MSSGPENLLKITYHGGGAKPLNAYLKMPSPTFSVLKREIAMFLEERSQPRCELRTYWIDEDHDEIEMSNQCDYDIFRAKRSERQHLQVAPLKESNDTPDDPSVFVIHDRVECDECNAAPIVGFRYKCIQCPNFDLCQKCEAQHKHAEHMMVRMPTDNCPSVIEAWVSGRSSGRRTSKRSKASYCPFVNSTTNAANGQKAGGFTAAQDTSEAQPEAKDHHHHHHGRKHHRRQMRQGIFSHIYDIMQDLAEGGAAETATKEDSPEAGASGAQKAADGSAKATNDAASKVAQEAANAALEAGKTAHYAAAKAAEAAVKAAHEAASLAGQNIPASCPFGYTPPHNAATMTAQNVPNACPFGFKLPTSADPKEKATSSTAPKTPPPTPDTTAPNVAEPEIKKSTESTNANTAPSHPLLNSQSLENLAQYVDPQYMKAGIQILNNFSEMFAKMLDPMDDASIPAQSPFQSARKNSTSSTASNLSSSSNTSSSKKTTVEKPIDETIKEAAAAAAAAAPENPMTEPIKATTPTPAARMAAENVSQLPENRRSQSADDDCEWQLISPNGSFNSVSPSTSTESVDGVAAAVGGVSTPIVSGINYEQLSKDLKAHVEQEQKREQELKDQQAATAAAAAATTATAPVAPAVEATEAPAAVPEERRAIAVYHADKKINDSVHVMIGMGFSNEGAWLTQLLESVNGNIPEALDLMSAAQRNNN